MKKIITNVEAISLASFKFKIFKAIVSLILILLTSNSCNKDDVNNGSGNITIEGTWVRLPGPSGDRTDLAIGGITGQPSNRVYMCEKKGSATPGLFKGTYSNNTIVWDAVYGLPDFSVNLIGSELELNCNVCLPTKYSQGPWAGECGPIQYTTKNIAVGINFNDPYLSDVVIHGVTINNIICPFTLLNSGVPSPDCSSSNSFISVNDSQMSANGYHTVLITYTSGGIIRNESSAIINSELTSQCNLYKFFRSGPNGNMYLIKM